MKAAKSPEVRYRKQLNFLVAKLRYDVNTQIIPLLKQLEPEYTTDQYAQTLEQAFNNLRAAYADIDQNAKIIANSFVTNSNIKNKTRFYAAMENAVGVNLQTIVQNEGLEDILTATTRENVNLIKSIPAEYFKNIETIVYTGTTQSNKAGSMIKQIQKQGRTTAKRAKLIARDQSSKLNSALSQQRQKNLGVEEYIWRTSGDDRVRPDHASKNGKVFRWDSPPKDTGHPGQDIQCFPGSTNINSFTKIDKLFRRWYSDKLTLLITGSGESITSTPNHLYFTNRGWVAAKNINVGDNILKIENQRFNGFKTNSQNIITFEDLFNTFSLVRGFKSRCGSKMQFHGDGVINQEVDIINLKSELWNTIEPEIYEQFEKFFFTWTIERIDRLIKFRSGDFTFKTMFTSSQGFVSFFSNLFSIFKAEFTNARIHSFASVSNSDTFSNQEVFNSHSFCTSEFRKLLDTIPSNIPIDNKFGIELFSIVCRSIMFWYHETVNPEILTQMVRVTSETCSRLFNEHSGFNKFKSTVKEISSVEFNGHVYNLENENSMYCANNLIVHNCRCVAQPLIKVDS